MRPSSSTAAGSPLAGTAQHAEDHFSMRSSCTCLFLLLIGCGPTPDDPGASTGDEASGGASGSAAVIGAGGSSAGTSAAGAASSGSSGRGGGAAGSTVGRGGGGAGGSSGHGAATDGGTTDAGAGGTAAHVVVPCDSAKVGVWEDITPPGVVSDPDFSAKKGFGTNAFVIDGSNSANITLGTDGIGIYRTTNCGSSWTHINTGQNAAALDGGTQWSMAIDPVDPNVIYTVSGYGTNGVFKTTNAGIDWKQTLAPEFAHVFVYDGFTAQVRVDPTEHLHLVVTPHFTCQAGHSETCFLETTDGGATWTVVENAPSSGEGARITLVDHNTWFSGLGYGGLFRTGNAGMSWTRVTSADSYAYEVFHRPNGKYYLPIAFGLAQSSDGISWTTPPNSPGAHVVTTSSTRIYVATGGHCVGGHAEAINPISSAPIDNATTWTVDKSFSNHWSSGDLQYDADHHMLYTSNCLGGFWRVRIE